jgi:hypothetical protein
MLQPPVKERDAGVAHQVEPLASSRRDGFEAPRPFFSGKLGYESPQATRPRARRSAGAHLQQLVGKTLAGDGQPAASPGTPGNLPGRATPMWHPRSPLLRTVSERTRWRKQITEATAT